MAKNKAKLVACTCEICGKKFMWKKHVTICQEKSTCRVLKHQRKMAKERNEKRVSMLSMDAVGMMNRVLDQAPEMKDFMAWFVEKHDATIVEDMLVMVYNTARCLTPMD